MDNKDSSIIKKQKHLFNLHNSYRQTIDKTKLAQGKYSNLMPPSHCSSFVWVDLALTFQRGMGVMGSPPPSPKVIDDQKICMVYLISWIYVMFMNVTLTKTLVLFPKTHFNYNYNWKHPLNSWLHIFTFIDKIYVNLTSSTQLVLWTMTTGPVLAIS